MIWNGRGVVGRLGAGTLFPLVLLPLLGAAPPGVEASPSLAELRERLETTVASMPAIKVRYTVRNEPYEEPGFEAEPWLKEMITPWGPWRYLWCKNGNRVLLSSYYEAADPRDTVAFDGDKAYFASGSGERATVHISTQISSSYGTAPKPDCLLGLAVPTTDRPLAEALRLPTAAVTGTESVDGVVCHRVEVRGISFSPSRPLRLTVWLDPEHDMLPRRVTTAVDVDDPRFVGDEASKSGWAKQRSTWRTAEFVRVANPARKDRSCWFPKRAYFHQLGCRQELIVEEAAVLASLPRDAFRLGTAAGSVVIDHAAGKRTPEVVGGRKALTKRVGAASARAAALASQGAPGRTDATPVRGPSWPLVIFFASSAVLTAVFVVWWRQRA